MTSRWVTHAALVCTRGHRQLTIPAHAEAMLSRCPASGGSGRTADHAARSNQVSLIPGRRSDQAAGVGVVGDGQGP